MTFEHIQSKYNLPNQTDFQYLQLKEVIQKSIGSCTLTNCNSHIYQTIESLKPNKILSQIGMHDICWTDKLYRFSNLPIWVNMTSFLLLL